MSKKCNISHYNKSSLISITVYSKKKKKKRMTALLKKKKKEKRMMALHIR